MKLLLTDSGVRNASIQQALVELLGKPIAESTALCIPTAGYGAPDADPFLPWNFVAGHAPSPMTGLGWKAVGILELTALPSIAETTWTTWVRQADVLLVNGGDPLYLAHWLRESGLAELLPELTDTVYVGLSAGSLAVTPRIGDFFVGWRAPPSSRAPRPRCRTGSPGARPAGGPRRISRQMTRSSTRNNRLRPVARTTPSKRCDSWPT